MSTYSINDISSSSDRHKLYVLLCEPNELAASLLFIQNQEINAINIGKELASFIEDLDNYTYLNFDVSDFLKKLLDDRKIKINGSENDVVALYNLGILLEPALELNTTLLLKEYSKSTALIIIFENHSDNPDVLHWPTQKSKYLLNFSETPLRKLQYAI